MRLDTVDAASELFRLTLTLDTLEDLLLRWFDGAALPRPPHDFCALRMFLPTRTMYAMTAVYAAWL